MKIQRLLSCLSLSAVCLVLVGTSAPSTDTANAKLHALPLPPPTMEQQTIDDLPFLVEQNSEATVFDEELNPIDEVNTPKNITTQPTTRATDITATVMAVADEEFRAAHPFDWKKIIEESLEKADNPFQQQHQIDLQIAAYGEWQSEGTDGPSLVQDLDKDWNTGEYDFVIGFTKDPHFTDGGLAYQYTEKPEKSAVSLVKDMAPQYLPHVLQHEISHNYNLSHDEKGSGIRCIMNYDYTYQTTEWHPEHNEILAKNRTWYGH